MASQNESLRDNNWNQSTRSAPVTQPPDPPVEIGITLMLALACLCLAAMIVLQILFWRHNRNANILLSNACSLMVYYVAVATRNYIGKDHRDVHLCYFIFMVNYYFLMSAVFWMSVMSYDVWLCLSERQPPTSICNRQCPGFACRERKYQYLRYSLVGWGIPALLLTTVLVLDHNRGLQDALALRPEIAAKCWFPTIPIKPLWIFGYGPLLCACVFNLIFFALTVSTLRQTVMECRMVGNQNHFRQMLIISIKLFAIMGIIMATTAVAFAVDTASSKQFGYIMMAVQGVAIFLTHLCKRTTFALLKQKCCPTR